MPEDLKQLEEKLKITFKDKNILKTAFTHRSYINESYGLVTEHNERLEFLGDAVLEVLVSEHLFKNFPELREGDMTTYRAAAVRMESLSETAIELGLGAYIFMAKGEEITGGRNRPYILANTFEALLGALFIDQGIEACKDFLSSIFFDKINKIVENKKYIDNKSKLQEITQERFKNMPIYKLIKEEGPDHDKLFTIKVILNNKVLAVGKGKTKQQAQQEAAKAALETLI